MKLIRRITALFLVLCLLLPTTAALATGNDAPEGDPGLGDIPSVESPAEEPPAEEPPAEQPPAEEPPAEEPPAEEPPAEEPPAEEPPAEEPPAEEPPVVEPPLATSLDGGDNIEQAIDDGDGKLVSVTDLQQFQDALANYTANNSVGIEVAGHIAWDSGQLVIPSGVNVFTPTSGTLTYNYQGAPLTIKPGGKLTVEGQLDVLTGGLNVEGELIVNGPLTLYDGRSSLTVSGTMTVNGLTVNSNPSINLNGANAVVKPGGALIGAGVTDALKSVFSAEYAPANAAALLSAVQEGSAWKHAEISVNKSIALTAAQRLNIPANTCVNVANSAAAVTLTLNGGFSSEGALVAGKNATVKLNGDSVAAENAASTDAAILVKDGGCIELNNRKLSIEGAEELALAGSAAFKATGQAAELLFDNGATLNVSGATATMAFNNAAALKLINGSEATNRGGIDFYRGAYLLIDAASLFTNYGRVNTDGSGQMQIDGRFVNQGGSENLWIKDVVTTQEALLAKLREHNVQSVRIGDGAAKTIRIDSDIEIPANVKVYIEPNTEVIFGETPCEMILRAGAELRIQQNAELVFGSNTTLVVEEAVSMINNGTLRTEAGGTYTDAKSNCVLKNYGSCTLDDAAQAFSPSYWELSSLADFERALAAQTERISVVKKGSHPFHSSGTPFGQHTIPSGTSVYLRPGASILVNGTGTTPPDAGSLTISENAYLILEQGSSLSTSEKGVITNEGEMIVEGELNINASSSSSNSFTGTATSLLELRGTGMLNINPAGAAASAELNGDVRAKDSSVVYIATNGRLDLRGNANYDNAATLQIDGILRLIGNARLNTSGVVIVSSSSNCVVTDNARVIVSGGTVNDPGGNLPHAYVLERDASNMAQLKAALREQNVGIINVRKSLSISENITIPAGVNVHLAPNGVKMTIAKGKTLTVADSGSLNIEPEDVNNNLEGAVLDNKGTLAVDGALHVNGVLLNYGTLNLTGSGTVSDNARIENQNKGVLNLENGACLTLEGGNSPNGGELQCIAGSTLNIKAGSQLVNDGLVTLDSAAVSFLGVYYGNGTVAGAHKDLISENRVAVNDIGQLRVKLLDPDISEIVLTANCAVDDEALTIPYGKTLTLPRMITFDIASGMELTIARGASLHAAACSIEIGDGRIVNNGMLTLQEDADIDTLTSSSELINQGSLQLIEGTISIKQGTLKNSGSIELANTSSIRSTDYDCAMVFERGSNVTVLDSAYIISSFNAGFTLKNGSYTDLRGAPAKLQFDGAGVTVENGAVLTLRDGARVNFSENHFPAPAGACMQVLPGNYGDSNRIGSGNVALLREAQTEAQIRDVINDPACYQDGSGNPYAGVNISFCPAGGKAVTLTADLILPVKTTLSITPPDVPAKLIVPAGKTLTNNGSIVIGRSTSSGSTGKPCELQVAGNIVNNGVIDVAGGNLLLSGKGTFTGNSVIMREYATVTNSIPRSNPNASATAVTVRGPLNMKYFPKLSDRYSVPFTAVIAPPDAPAQSITWGIEKDAGNASADPSIDSNGTATFPANSEGSYTVKATHADGAEGTLTIELVDEDFVELHIDGAAYTNNPMVMLGGQSMDVSMWNYQDSRDGAGSMEPIPYHIGVLDYAEYLSIMASGDESAILSAKSANAAYNPKTGVLTTKPVKEPTVLNVFAIADKEAVSVSSILDEKLGIGDMVGGAVILLPPPSGVLIKDVTDASAPVYVTGTTRTLVDGSELVLEPELLPKVELTDGNIVSGMAAQFNFDARLDASNYDWTSDKSYFTATNVGNTGKVRVSVHPVTGPSAYPVTETLTCTVTDPDTGIEKSASVKIQITKMVTGIKLYDNGGNLVDPSTRYDLDVMAGGKVQIRAEADPPNVPNTKLTYTLAPGHSQFASVSAAGLVSAKTTVLTKTTVEVVIQAADGSGVQRSAYINIYPKATGGVIKWHDNPRYSNFTLATGKTIYLDVPDTQTPAPCVWLSAALLPKDAYTAGDWNWSYPNELLEKTDAPSYIGSELGKIQVFSPIWDTEANAYKTGRFSVMASMPGGTSVTTQFVVGKFADSVAFVNPPATGATYKPGDTFDLRAEALRGSNPAADSSVRWDISGYENVITLKVINPNTARVTVKSPLYQEINDIKVKAYPADNPITTANAAEYSFHVAPKDDILTIEQYDGSNYSNKTGMTLYCGFDPADLNAAGNVVTLRMRNLSDTDFDPAATLAWTPGASNAITNISVSGDTITLWPKKAGTVKLTAKATLNRAVRTAAVTVVFVEKINKIEIYSATPADGLGVGKSLQLNAFINGNMTKPNNSAVDWSLGSLPAGADASISATGKLTLKAAAQGCDVWVHAKAKDGSVTGSGLFYLHPLATSVSIIANNNNVTGTTLLLERDELLPLSAIVAPTIAGGLGAYDNIIWTSSNEKIAKITGSGTVSVKVGSDLPKNGGTATITATAMDGSGKKATVKVTVKEDVRALSIDCADANYKYTPSSGGMEPGARVTAGKTLKLTPNFGAGNNPTNQKLRWWLDARDAQFASISAAGVLSAKASKSVATVTVHCEATDGSGVAADPLKVYITPPITAINVYQPTYSSSPNILCNGKTIAWPSTFGGHTPLLVSIEPAGAVLDLNDVEKLITVNSSNPGLVSVRGDAPDLSTFCYVYNAIGDTNPGKATVTFAPRDGGKKTTVNFTLTKLTTHIKYTLPNGEENEGSGSVMPRPSPIDTTEVTAGKSIQLKAEGAFFDASTSQMSPAANKKVTWSVMSGAEYITLSAAGRVTAKAGCERQSAIVRATAADGSDVCIDIQVDIVPAAQSIAITNEAGDVVTNQTLTIEPEISYIFKAPRTPGYACDATQTLWTASNKSVDLRMQSNGDLELTVPASSAVKLGSTITLTAATADGSAKKAIVKLKVERLTDELYVTDPNGEMHGTLYIGVGKSLQLRTNAYCFKTGQPPSNTKVTWKLTEGAQYATLSAAGRLTAKAGTTTGERIAVQAEALDGSGKVSPPLAFVVAPAITTMNIQTYPRQYVTGKTLTIEQGERASFAVQYAPLVSGQNAKFYWTSSNTGITLDGSDPFSTGSDWMSITASDTVKVGTIVTLTAAATDGSGKKAIVKLKVKAKP